MKALRARAFVLSIALVAATLLSAGAQQPAAPQQQLKPIANAGPDEVAAVGVPVTLDASASTGGAPLSYAWTFASRPTGSTAVLTAPNTVNPTFVPDLPGTYSVRLVVSSAKAKSKPDTVNVTARHNVVPIAAAG